MANKELFDVTDNQFQKSSVVLVTATAPGAPQTIVTMTTASLPAGDYTLYYSFQATHSAKNQPFFYKLDGTYPDAEYFSNSASDTDELHVNRLYGYPKPHAGGPITMTFLAYKPTGTVTLDFCDVVLTRVG